MARNGQRPGLLVLTSKINQLFFSRIFGFRVKTHGRPLRLVFSVSRFSITPAYRWLFSGRSSPPKVGYIVEAVTHRQSRERLDWVDFSLSTKFHKGLLCTVNGLPDVYSDRGDAAQKTFTIYKMLPKELILSTNFFNRIFFVHHHRGNQRVTLLLPVDKFGDG